MRIAIVTESFLPRTDGVVRTVVELLHYLHGHDHQALVFAAGPGPTEYAGFDVVRVRGPRFPLYPAITIAPFSAHMLGTLRTWRPDIVHLASPFVLGMQGRRAAHALGVPVAAHYQTDVARYAHHFKLGLLAGLARRHLVRLHNACDRTYAPTPSVRADLIAQGMRQVHILGRGVDADLFRPERRSPALRRALLREGEQTLFLYVGRLSKEKNLDPLAPMLAALPDVRLVFVGEGPYRASLEQTFHGLRASFVGLRHGEELACYYASADVFTFPRSPRHSVRWCRRRWLPVCRCWRTARVACRTCCATVGRAISARWALRPIGGRPPSYWRVIAASVYALAGARGRAPRRAPGIPSLRDCCTSTRR